LDVSNTKDHDDFLLIKCQLAEPSVGDGVQVLILPPKLRRKQTDLLRGKQRISISIILTGTGTVIPDSGLIFLKKNWTRAIWNFYVWSAMFRICIHVWIRIQV
jgi:hypothetical protein